MTKFSALLLKASHSVQSPLGVYRLPGYDEWLMVFEWMRVLMYYYIIRIRSQSGQIQVGPLLIPHLFSSKQSLQIIKPQGQLQQNSCSCLQQWQTYLPIFLFLYPPFFNITVIVVLLRKPTWSIHHWCCGFPVQLFQEARKDVPGVTVFWLSRLIEVLF